MQHQLIQLHWKFNRSDFIALIGGTGALNIGTNLIAHTLLLEFNRSDSYYFKFGTGAINIGTNAIAHTIYTCNSTGAHPLY